jgi:hypothetical protein
MLEQYARTSAELHRKLNDPKYTGDVNAEYKAFWAATASLRHYTENVLGGTEFSLHDSRVFDLSSRKLINEYFIQFRVNAFRYEDTHEVGYQRMLFTVESTQNMREINKRELFDFVVDEVGKKMLFMYWGHKRMRSIIVPFTFLHVGHEPQVN